MKIFNVSDKLNEEVVLVDEHDNVRGTMDKLEAHKHPQLHRAVSVLLYDENNRFLIQQRAPSKYHAPLLWANACCTHPRVGENPLSAAQRRVFEELGVHTSLVFDRKTLYAVQVGDLFEYELSHIFVGKIPNGHSFALNSQEVSDVRWLEVDELFEALGRQNLTLAPWFQIYLSLWGADYLKNLPKNW